MAGGVCPDFGLVAPFVDFAVACDVPVIADVGKSTGNVHLPDLVDGIILTLGGGRAMEDYLVDAARVR